MKHVLRILVACLLTVPVCLALSKCAPIAEWVGRASTWKALRPLFDIAGAYGVEGDENVVVTLLLAASFLIAWGLVWRFSVIFEKRKYPDVK